MTHVFHTMLGLILLLTPVLLFAVIAAYVESRCDKKLQDGKRSLGDDNSEK